MSKHVVRVTSLASFLVEVPAGGEARTIVRLTPTEAFLPGRGKMPVPRKSVSLSLQGVNPRGEIVWLCESYTLLWLGDGPSTPRDRSIHAGILRLRDLVAAHLERLGYEVREGDYALPAHLQPLNAKFECARWVRTDGAEEWRPESVAE